MVQRSRVHFAGRREKGLGSRLERFHMTSKSRKNYAIRHIGVLRASRQDDVVRSHRVFEANWPPQRCFVLQNTQGCHHVRFRSLSSRSLSPAREAGCSCEFPEHARGLGQQYIIEAIEAVNSTIAVELYRLYLLA